MGGALAGMAAPGLGAGPFRAEQIEDGRRGAWLRYDFDPARTAALARAARDNLGVEVGNPAVVLRTPNQADVVAVLAAAVRRGATDPAADPAEVLRGADRELRAVAGKVPAETWKGWLRNQAGLQ